MYHCVGSLECFREMEQYFIFRMHVTLCKINSIGVGTNHVRFWLFSAGPSIKISEIYTIKTLVTRRSAHDV
jgi:hypothetical protein